MKALILILTSILLSIVNVNAQQVPCSSEEQYNLLKYWNLRDRMDWWVKQGYVDVYNNCPPYGSKYGYNLVPSHFELDVNNTNNTIKEFQLRFGDGTSELGWYIAILATEYELLRQQGLPTDRTLSELWRSMETYYRLDAMAEMLPPYGSYWQAVSGNGGVLNPGCNFNGYFIRQDVGLNMNGMTSDQWYQLGGPAPNRLISELTAQDKYNDADHPNFKKKKNGTIITCEDKLDNKKCESRVRAII